MNTPFAQYVGQVEEAAAWLRREAAPMPAIAVIAGSGLGSLAQAVDARRSIPYGDIPHFPVSTVAGHAGQLIIGSLDGVPVVVQSGRKHLYEGADARTATLPVRALARAGVGVLIVSNAAGGLNRTFMPGDLMLMSDHINFQFQNPLVGPNEEAWGPRFPDMSAPYDPGLRALAREVARRLGIPLREGVYIANLGPSYETVAEVGMERLFGADAVGMSTVPETLVARHMGVRVVGITCITNSLVLAPGRQTTHEEVLQTARLAEGRFERLVRGLVAEIHRELG
ncbi:MAG: purine nucleoside phosphorylase I, inosine and guanosine-specific [Candidatus Sumerlaeia bacterium]